MKRMTKAEAIEQGFNEFYIIPGSLTALNSVTGDCVELFTPLEADLIESLYFALSRIDIDRQADKEIIYKQIKKARGEA